MGRGNGSEQSFTGCVMGGDDGLGDPVGFDLLDDLGRARRVEMIEDGGEFSRVDPMNGGPRSGERDVVTTW